MAVSKSIKRNKTTDLDIKVLINIIEAVNKYTNLEDIYKVALDSVVELEIVDMVAIFLIDEKSREAVLVSHRNLPRFFIKRASRIPEPKGLTWKVINTGEVLNIKDVQKEPEIGHAGKKLGQHSSLIIPILLENKTYGVLWFISYKERIFNKKEVNLLLTLGNQIAIALTKAKIIEELRKSELKLKRNLHKLSKKTRYENIIIKVTKSVHKSINLIEVMENAVDAITNNIDVVKNISIYLVEGTDAVLKAYRGYPRWYIKRVEKIPYPRGTTWKTINLGKSRYISNTKYDKIIGLAGKNIGTKSYLSMPLKFEGNTVGCININSLKINAFTKDEINLIEIIARQIEAAFKNAKQAEALLRSEKKIREAKNELEYKVLERTAELSKANKSLLEHIKKKKIVEKQLKNSKEQLRALAANLQSAREEERKHIAREIHDELGQALTRLKIDLSRIENQLFNNRSNIRIANSVKSKIDSMSSIIKSTLNVTRKIATDLRPGILDDLGLIAAIEWQAEEFRKRTGIACNIITEISEINLNQEISTAFFRIFQETLTNILRHAEASRINTYITRLNGKLVLEVKDNGIGISKNDISKSKSLGLLGIRERAKLFGGEVKIKGIKNRGTTVKVSIPVIY